jgi:hypothetical protein
MSVECAKSCERRSVFSSFRAVEVLGFFFDCRQSELTKPAPMNPVTTVQGISRLPKSQSENAPEFSPFHQPEGSAICQECCVSR